MTNMVEHAALLKQRKQESRGTRSPHSWSWVIADWLITVGHLPMVSGIPWGVAWITPAGKEGWVYWPIRGFYHTRTGT